jgi:hypothetical protein
MMVSTAMCNYYDEFGVVLEDLHRVYEGSKLAIGIA